MLLMLSMASKYLKIATEQHLLSGTRTALHVVSWQSGLNRSEALDYSGLLETIGDVSRLKDAFDTIAVLVEKGTMRPHSKSGAYAYSRRVSAQCH